MRYTPARVMEEVNGAFRRMPREEVHRLLSRKEPLSLKHRLSMFTERGKPRIIEVHLRPWVVDRAQIRFFHRVCLRIRSALERLLPLYLADPMVRRVLPLEPEEQEWVLAANAGRLQRPQTVVDRLDTTVNFTIPDWQNNFWFLEPNSVGIGGVHYMPATCELTGEWVVPAIRRRLPDLRIAFQSDIRQILLSRFHRHARAIGRRLRRVALVEDQSFSGGTDEFGSLAAYFRRNGLAAVTADPRDVALWRDQITVGGRPVELIYRDSEINEILEMGRGKGGRSIAGIREAFLRNQVISSVAGEFDHKSAWELFTNRQFARYFTRSQQRLFRRHLLWTRLLWERKTEDPAGRRVELFSYARRNREALLLKPNRAYGGEGVIFGHQVSRSVWEKGLERAIRSPFQYVIQKSAQVQAELFPVAARNGTVRLEPYYAVTGFAASPEGLAILGRASREPVVNVSRRGGLIAVWTLM